MVTIFNFVHESRDLLHALDDTGQSETFYQLFKCQGLFSIMQLAKLSHLHGTLPERIEKLRNAVLDVLPDLLRDNMARAFDLCYTLTVTSPLPSVPKDSIRQILASALANYVPQHDDRKNVKVVFTTTYLAAAAPLSPPALLQEVETFYSHWEADRTVELKCPCGTTIATGFVKTNQPDLSPIVAHVHNMHPEGAVKRKDPPTLTIPQLFGSARYKLQRAESPATHPSM